MCVRMVHVCAYFDLVSVSVVTGTCFNLNSP